MAALLHDIGHLLHSLSEDCAERGIDDRHEQLGYRFLLRHFGPDVAEPVRLHVAAKRYLCAVDANYHSCLSPTSMRSLRLQGGAFSAEQFVEFRCSKYGESAVAVRRWDDIAKTPGLVTPGLEHFQDTLDWIVNSGNGAILA